MQGYGKHMVPTEWGMVAAPQRAVAKSSTVGIRQDLVLPISEDEQTPDEVRELPISKKQVQEAREVLNKYKGAKKAMDERLVKNEEWWRGQHLNQIMHKQKKATDTPSAWLFNSISNKHADAMDNFPTCSVLPREESDRKVAEILSNVLPVVMEKCDFEQVYSDCWDYKLVMGMSCYHVAWNKQIDNGIGDVEIKKVDLLNLFWEPAKTDIQDSGNVFYCYAADTAALEMQHPEYKGKLGGIDEQVSKYVYNDGADKSGKTAVVDWYYKRQLEDGRTVLHLCTFAGDYVLFSTENEGMESLYDHGMYPFILDPLFKLEGTLEAFGYVDVMKGVQTRIDRQQNAITNYAAKAMRVRYFKRDNCGVNVEQFADLTRDFVDVTEGRMDEDNLRQIKVDPIDSIWVQILNNNVEELKAVSGNSDVSQGIPSGVTAASAVAALQEAAGKLSRDMIKASYRVYRKICIMVIELMRQFYEETRYFRITEADGGMAFVSMNNAMMRPQNRLPVYDVVVKAQKQSAYSQIARNELVKEFYNMGFFNPQQADIALAALRMMDFEGKEEVISVVEKNAIMQKLCVQLAGMVDPDGSRGILQGMMDTGLISANDMGRIGGGTGGMPVLNSLGAEMGTGNIAERAKMQAQESAAPR